MTTQPFLRPRLTGARFEGGAVPLEFLKDLAVLEEMIIEVAKSEFFKDHPDRQRSPRGFTEGIELKLTGIEDGSATPVISLEVTPDSLFLPPENQEYFQRARDSIIEAIDASEQNRPITDHLPEKSLGYFDRFGRSLREGEAIEFVTSAREKRTRLTRETRRRLLLASSRMKELTDGTSVRGSVPEVDQDNMTFEVQLIDGRRVKAPLDPQHFDTILEAFNNYQDGTRVLLQGIGRFNRNERLLRFDSIEHVTSLDPLDIPSRLEELRLLKDGWLEGSGKGPSREGLEWFAKAFSHHYPDELPLPFLYPTAEGGVQAEWTLAPTEITLEIDLETRQGAWHALNTDTDSEISRGLELEEADDWRWLTGEIQRLGGGSS